MATAYSHGPIIFGQDAKEAFQQHLVENPSNRRVSRDDHIVIIEWLINPLKRPSSQTEHSRRNYVRRTFVLDDHTHCLFENAKEDGDRNRIVVTQDMIVDVVASVHERNGHSGWDATWNDVKASYYGILRSDVIFLLKRCVACASNPSKQPKSSKNSLGQ